jgi:hypothetical protein
MGHFPDSFRGKHPKEHPKENRQNQGWITRDGSPWITRDIPRLIRKRYRWYKRKKKSGDKSDISKHKELKRKTQEEIRRGYWKYIEGIVTSDSKQKDGNSRNRFWTFIKHRRSDGYSIPPSNQLEYYIRIQKTKPTYLIANSNRHS